MSRCQLKQFYSTRIIMQYNISKFSWKDIYLGIIYLFVLAKIALVQVLCLIWCIIFLFFVLFLKYMFGRFFILIYPIILWIYHIFFLHSWNFYNSGNFWWIMMHSVAKKKRIMKKEMLHTVCCLSSLQIIY